MTTDPEQMQLVDDSTTVHHLEAAVELMLRRLTAWTKLPEDRTDWELEQLLDELGATCLALRRLRGEVDLPF